MKQKPFPGYLFAGSLLLLLKHSRFHAPQQLAEPAAPRGAWANHRLEKNPVPLGPSRRSVPAEPPHPGLTEALHPDWPAGQSEAAFA